MVDVALCVHTRRLSTLPTLTLLKVWHCLLLIWCLPFEHTWLAHGCTHIIFTAICHLSYHKRSQVIRLDFSHACKMKSHRKSVGKVEEEHIWTLGERGKEGDAILFPLASQAGGLWGLSMQQLSILNTPSLEQTVGTSLDEGSSRERH